MAKIQLHDLELDELRSLDNVQEQSNIHGGSWLSDAFRWVVDHLGGQLTDGGFIITYKGTHDFPNNL